MEKIIEIYFTYNLFILNNIQINYYFNEEKK